MTVYVSYEHLLEHFHEHFYEHFHEHFHVVCQQPGQETSDMSIVLRDIENYVNEIKVSSRKVSIASRQRLW